MTGERWDALVDDAVHEINMRWGIRLDNSDEPDTEPMDQVMVRATAEAILRPVENDVERLRAALKDIAKEANEGGVFHEGICADSGHRCAYVVQMAHAALGAEL